MPRRRPQPQPANEGFLTITGLARAAGLEPHVVRFYARLALIRPARLGANGYRQFVVQDVKRVRFVRAAQSLGFTLREIREIMHRSRQGRTPCPLVRDLIGKRLRENHERLLYMRALQRRMENASERWRKLPDQVPTGESICVLIETVADETPKLWRTGSTRARAWRPVPRGAGGLAARGPRRRVANPGGSARR